MLSRILAAGALVMGLSVGALAQTDSSTESPGAAATSPMPGWDQSVADAFFADPTMGTLRPQDEIRQNWVSLSPEQQAQVRSDCAEASGAANGTQGTTMTELCSIVGTM